MFDIGWSELVLIAIVALIVVGPKELPGLFRTVGQYAGKARSMAREFQRSMEQAADESGLKEAADGLKSVNRLNTGSAKDSARKFAENSIRNKPADASTSAGGKPDAPEASVSEAAAGGTRSEGTPPASASEPAPAGTDAK